MADSGTGAIQHHFKMPPLIDWSLRCLAAVRGNLPTCWTAKRVQLLLARQRRCSLCASLPAGRTPSGTAETQRSLTLVRNTRRHRAHQQPTVSMIAAAFWCGLTLRL